MPSYDVVTKMAMDLSYGTLEQKKEVADMIRKSDSEELVNILEGSREVGFDNTGDDDLFQAIVTLIDFIQMDLATRIFQN